jgi:hypothetical protein
VIVALAIVLGFVLSALSALHLYWAFGGTWPARDEPELVRTVVGDPRLKRMPSRGAAIAVAVALDAAALLALLLAFRLQPMIDLVITFGGCGLALVFLGRGIVGYTPPWRRRLTLEPFARLDRMVYSPLCLALGAGFVCLVATRFA